MTAHADPKHPLHRLKTSLRDLRGRHQERHRPTGFGFALADRVDYLDAARWDAVTSGASVFLRRDVLRVIEKHGPENIQPRYALVFRDDTPVAAVMAQMVLVTGERLRAEEPARKKARPAHVLARVLAPAAGVATARLRERMLVAGNLLSWGFMGSPSRRVKNRLTFGRALPRRSTGFAGPSASAAKPISSW
jgi:hypothetical protein